MSRSKTVGYSRRISFCLRPDVHRTSIIWGLPRLASKLTQRGSIAVDDHYRTNVDNIYAIGDVIDRVQLTPVAIAEGMVIADNLFNGTDRTLDYSAIPTAVFCQPNIGAVGLTEAEAKERLENIRVFESTFRPMKHTMSGRSERTLMKLIVDSRTDRVVGAHMVGPDAGEIIQGLGVALKAGRNQSSVRFDHRCSPHCGRRIRHHARARSMNLRHVVSFMGCLLATASCATDAAKSSAAGSAQAHNVILFVGDGMGIATVTATRILDGQRKGGQGEDNVLSFEEFPYTAFSKTYTYDYQVGESAGTITAMMSGEKTHSAVLGESVAVTPGKCEGAAAASIATLLEQAADRGLATGVVTTTRITHATPGGTYSHTPSRDWESDVTTPLQAQQLGCRDIARQLAEFTHGHGIDVMFGGGRALFLPNDVADPENGDQHGIRKDGRNLIEQWKAGGPQRTFIWNATQLEQLPVVAGTQVMGLFAMDHMQFDFDRATLAPGEPSLAQMTAKAIEILSKNPKGYFLMVEGGRIDHGHHAGNAYRALTDGIAFADAVAVADEGHRCDGHADRHDGRS